MNSRMLKPMVHQMVTKATNGMNSGMVRVKIGTCSPQNASIGMLGDAELDVDHPVPDPVDHRDRQDVGQEEEREHEALQPALEPVDAQRDGEARAASSGSPSGARSRACSRVAVQNRRSPQSRVVVARSPTQSPQPISGASVKLSTTIWIVGQMKSDPVDRRRRARPGRARSGISERRALEHGSAPLRWTRSGDRPAGRRRRSPSRGRG